MKPIITIPIFFLLGALLALIFYYWQSHRFSEPKIITQIESEKSIQYQDTAFSITQAPRDSLQGQITKISGEVSRQSRAGISSALLGNSALLQQGEKLITNEDGTISFNIASKSAVTMRPQSELEIIQTLPVNLVFWQISGRAEYESLSDTPVSIRSLNLILNLNKGLCRIHTDREAGEITITLTKGNAAVAYNSIDYVSKVWQMEAGDTFVYNSSKRQGYFN